MSENKVFPLTASLQVKPEDCILCYACVRECPARAIEVKPNSPSAKIIPERCTACGSCYKVCPTEAIIIPTDLERVRTFLKGEKKTIALIDPSISAEFHDITDYRSLVGMIKALGFNSVNDVSFGADLVAQEYKRIFEKFKGKYFISSKCPAVVYQVSKYYPKLVENLVPLCSPAAAMAAVVRKQFGDDIIIVAISPCLAIKMEMADPVSGNIINAHITFKELRQLFEEHDISETQVEYQEFDKPHGRKGSLYPLTSGLMQAAEQIENLLDSNFHSASGRGNMTDAIQEFTQTNEIKKHLDLFYCEGCIMGPGMSSYDRKFMKQTLVKEYTLKRLAVTDEKEWKADIREYSQLNLERTFKADDQKLNPANPKKVQEVLQTIGKDKSDNTDRGCSACGYQSCKEFAEAVALGLAKVDMCHSFGSKNRQEYIESLQKANEDLANTKKALEESEKITKEEKKMVQAFSDTISAVMERIPSGVIIADAKLKIVQANQVMIDLLGEEARNIHEIIPGLRGAGIKSLITPNIFQLFSYVIQNNQELINKDIKLNEKILNLSIFPIHKGNTYGAIFRDMASPEVQKEEVIKRVTETIDKHLEMVQKIGFLLGEGAADTEKMLNSIIQSFQSKDKR